MLKQIFILVYLTCIILLSGCHEICESNGSTVMDSSTGLVWQTGQKCKGISWKDAKSYCKDLELGGYSNWRLPSFDEHHTLLGGCEKNLGPEQCDDPEVDGVLISSCEEISNPSKTGIKSSKYGFCYNCSHGNSNCSKLHTADTGTYWALTDQWETGVGKKCLDKSGTGDWILKINDMLPFSTGKLISWSIEFPGGKNFSKVESLDIPDFGNGVLSSTISVKDVGIIEKVKLSLKISHEYIDDLNVSLSSPNNKRLDIMFSVSMDRKFEEDNKILEKMTEIENSTEGDFSESDILEAKEKYEIIKTKYSSFAEKIFTISKEDVTRFFSADADCESGLKCKEKTGEQGLKEGICHSPYSSPLLAWRVHYNLCSSDCSDKSADGTWSLYIADVKEENKGKLNNWSIEFLDDSGVLDTFTNNESLDIPDNEAKGISNSIDVSGIGILQELKISVDISHIDKGDLRVILESPELAKGIVFSPKQSDIGKADVKLSVNSSSFIRTFIGDGDCPGDWTCNHKYCAPPKSRTRECSPDNYCYDWPQCKSYFTLGSKENYLENMSARCVRSE